MENYPGVPLEYSASDYHHVARPMPVTAPKHASASHFRNHVRRRSQFSIVSDESAKRDSYYKDPITAVSTNTKESYDPYRSSRTPIVNGNTEYATVVVRQGSGASRVGKGNRATSLRHTGVSKCQHQAHANRNMSSREHGQAAQHKGHANGSGHSRSSLASSRRSELAMRKSVSYRRQVSFQHGHQRSSGSSSRARGRTRLVSSDTESSKGNNSKQGLPESQSTPSLPTPPRIRRPRKPASDLDIKKARAVSHYWKDEARKVSSELGKICEEAFNRSSVSSSNVSQKNVESPTTSISTQGETLVPLSSQFKDRPLPQPPAESLGSYTLRELAETRRRLLEHCQDAGSDAVPMYLKEVITHLDRLMQPALRPEDGEQRSASVPNPAFAKNSSHLVAISEDSPRVNGSQETQSSRSASEPLQSSKQVSLQDPSKSIRLVLSDATSHPQLPAIQPLNIRKKSLTPCDSLRSPSSESLRGTMGRTGHDRRLYGGLDTIEEDPKSPKNKDLLGSPGGAKKWSWFKRHSDPVDDFPPAPPMKDSPPGAETSPGIEASANHTGFNGSKGKTGSTDGLGESGEMAATAETKRKWFTKMFGKAGKSAGADAAKLVIVQDIASETDSNAASTEDLLAECRGQSVKTGNTSKSIKRGPTEPSPMTASTATSGGTRSPYISQNWFAKFFHIKPASRTICLCVGKAKARREIVKILREWKKYGLRDVVSEGGDGGDLIKGRVDSMNCM